MSGYIGNRRFDDNGKLNSILLIDNEHENVADLEIALRTAGAKRFADGEGVIYAESPDEAVEEMTERINDGRGYSAVIMDNHFDFDDGVQTIDGQDFLRILYGGFGYCISQDHADFDLGNFERFSTFNQIVETVIGKSRRPRSTHVRTIYEFMERNFGKPSEYQNFIRYYFGRVDRPYMIMLAGSPESIDETGIEDVEKISKKVGMSEEKPEIMVLSALIGEGILPEDDAADSLDEHPRFSEYLDRHTVRPYNPRAAHVRRHLKKGKKFSRSPFK